MPAGLTSPANHPGLKDQGGSGAGAGGFGSDTLVQLPNSADVLKTVSEWISAYEDDTAGSEDSSVTIKTLDTGIQVTGLQIIGESLLKTPISIRYLADPDTGIDRSAANTLAFVVGGAQAVLVNALGIRLVNTGLFFSANGAGATYTSGDGDVRLTPDTAAGIVQIGNAAALATNSTIGFPTFPTCAGAPTGNPTLPTGHAAMVIDTTNDVLAFRYGGAWHTVALT